MQRLLPVLVQVGHLGLGGAWLLNGIAYLLTPPAMAKAIGVPSGVREGLGVAMLVLGVVVAAGAIAKGKLVQAGPAIATAAGIGWTLYALARHWPMFAAFFVFLAVVGAGLGVVRSRMR